MKWGAILMGRKDSGNDREFDAVQGARASILWL
jgi:hypothetical protein